MPDPEKIKEHRHLRFLGKLLHDPNLWHLNRRSVSKAFFVGLFCAFVPVPFQMLLGAIGAVILRCNMPISVGLVWVTNPVTMLPIFSGAYVLGAFILGVPQSEFEPEFSWDWFATGLSDGLQPFLLGCFICGVVFGVVGYMGMQLFWRWHIVTAWKERSSKRRKQ